jgi:hypothetical protein
MVAALVVLAAMLVEAFYAPYQTWMRRRQYRDEALALLRRWQAEGRPRFSARGRALFTPEEGLFFVDD